MARPKHEFPDDLVERFIREHPEGASNEEIAEYFYCSSETVRLIFESAKAKLKKLDDPRLPDDPEPSTNLVKAEGVWRVP